MSPERGRLLRALLLSLLIHGLLSSLSFEYQGLGIPGFEVPWRDRRIEAPDLRVVLVPAQVAVSEQTLGAVAEPLRQAFIVQPFAAAAAVTLSAATAPAAGEQAGASARKVRAAAKADPATAALSANERARTGARGGTAPAPVPAPAVIAVEKEVEEVFVAPPSPPVRTPVSAAAPGASSPAAVAQAVPDSGGAAPERIDEEAKQRRIELAGRERAEQEAQRQAEQMAKQREIDAAQRSKRDEESARLDAQRQEAGLQRIAQEELARRDAARSEAEQKEAARQEAARQEAARVEAARLEAARQEAARQEAARQEAARQEAERVEAARHEAARQEAARQEAARQQTARVEAARLEAARQEASRLEEARLQAARRQAEEAARREAAPTAAASALGEQGSRSAQQDRADGSRAASAGREPSVSGAPAQVAPPPVAAAQGLPARAAESSRRPEAQPALRTPLTQATTSSGARRRTLFGRTDPNVDLVTYADAWRRKIELNMTFDLVRGHLKQPRTDPLVTVALRSDGSVESVTFNRSSGVAQLDEAIRRIVYSQAPYEAFPPGLAREYDVVEIRRTWMFDMAIRLY
jgi:TonB C terminal